MKRREPAAVIEGPDDQGMYMACWPQIEAVRGEGGSPDQARRALFDALVAELRRGIDAEQRARLDASQRRSPAERTRRAARLFELTWSRR